MKARGWKIFTKIGGVQFLRVLENTLRDSRHNKTVLTIGFGDQHFLYKGHILSTNLGISHSSVCKYLKMDK